MIEHISSIRLIFPPSLNLNLEEDCESIYKKAVDIIMTKGLVSLTIEGILRKLKYT